MSTHQEASEQELLRDAANSLEDLLNHGFPVPDSRGQPVPHQADPTYAAELIQRIRAHLSAPPAAAPTQPAANGERAMRDLASECVSAVTTSIAVFHNHPVTYSYEDAVQRVLSVIRHFPAPATATEGEDTPLAKLERIAAEECFCGEHPASDRCWRCCAAGLLNDFNRDARELLAAMPRHTATQQKEQKK